MDHKDEPKKTPKNKVSKSQKLATAILEKKKAPHKLMAEESKNNDNSSV